MRNNVTILSFHISKWTAKKLISMLVSFLVLFCLLIVIFIVQGLYQIESIWFYTRSQIIRASVRIIILDGITKGPPTFQRFFYRRGSSLTWSHVAPEAPPTRRQIFYPKLRTFPFRSTYDQIVCTCR